MRCVELAAESPPNPPEEGEFRVFNQFTGSWSTKALAEMVGRVARSLDLDPEVVHLDNPRVEKETHYYKANNTRLIDLGLKPHLLDEETVEGLLLTATANRERIRSEVFAPQVNWRNPSHK